MLNESSRGIYTNKVVIISKKKLEINIKLNEQKHYEKDMVKKAKKRSKCQTHYTHLHLKSATVIGNANAFIGHI